MTARSPKESWARISDWTFCGKRSVKREMAPLASRVCKVEKTRWPVSATLKCHLGCLAVADFSHEHDIGVLAQSVLQAVGEGVHVDPDFPLGDDGVRLLGEQVLDRFFDGDDPAASFPVEEVDEHGQRGGLARPGHARDKDEAVAEVGKAVRQFLRELGPVKVGNLGRDDPEACSYLLIAQEEVHPKPLILPTHRQFEREVGVLLDVEASHCLFRTERPEQAGESLPIEWGFLQFLQLAVNSKNRRVVCNQMQVRGAKLDRLGEPASYGFGTDGVG